MASATSTSDGAMRASSDAKRPSGASVARRSPLASTSQAMPATQRLRSRWTAASAASALAFSRPVSVTVPGVTTRTTLRSTGPLLVAGSPICSQMATDSPILTSRARYCSTETTGTPAIGIGAPAEVPRLVSVMFSSRAARSASAKNSS